MIIAEIFISALSFVVAFFINTHVASETSPKDPRWLYRQTEVEDLVVYVW